MSRLGVVPPEFLSPSINSCLSTSPQRNKISFGFLSSKENATDHSYRGLPSLSRHEAIIVIKRKVVTTALKILTDSVDNAKQYLCRIIFILARVKSCFSITPAGKVPDQNIFLRKA